MKYSLSSAVIAVILCQTPGDAAVVYRAAGMQPADPSRIPQRQTIGAPPEALDMRLVGFDELQARSANQPTIPSGRSLDRLHRPPWRH